MTSYTHVPLPAVLKTTTNVNAYSDSGAALKDAFHKQGKVFLTRLAKTLGLLDVSYEVRSNLGGVAVSGEVTLHSDDIYIQLSERCTSRGIYMLYRTCDGRKDYCGHQNRFAQMTAFSGVDNQLKMLKQLGALVAQEQKRKASQLVAA